MKNDHRLLVIAAHPDDEILGCGASVSKLIGNGYEAYTLILGEGLTSRDNERDRMKRKIELKELKKNVLTANNILGVKDIFIYDYPDNRFDTIPFLDIVKTIEKIIKDIKPKIVFTHFEKDLNIDHRITCRAVLTATRPLPDESVKEIYSFEILSSTEYNYPLSFSPNVFFDISEHIDKKMEAIRAYKSELRDFPHPRSLESIKSNAGYWGSKVGIKYAEAFYLVRVVR